MATFQKGDKKLIRGWMMYDWANSVFPLVITTAIFPIFYEAVTKTGGDSVIVNGQDQVYVTLLGFKFINTSLIAYVGALGFLLVAFMSPFLSGVADYIGRKKLFLKIFAYAGSAGCAGLYFFDVEHLHWGLLAYLIALMGFCGSLVFYNAYLPEIAEKKDHDRISAGGFTLGYIGSVLLMIICILVIELQAIGADTTTDLGKLALADAKMTATRFSFVLVGLWWFGFSHVFFYRLKESKERYNKSSKVLLNGFRELKSVWNQLKTNKVLKRFLSAYFVYSTGVQTVIMVAVYFAAKEIFTGEFEAQKSTGLIASVVLIQLVAIAGAYGMSNLSKRIGNIKTLQIVVLMWAALSLWAYFITTPLQFYITAAFVGLVMGGVQSLSRSTYSKLIPSTTDTSSYFSFYDMTEKIGIVLGMAMFASLEAITGSMRNSILVIGGVFILGFLLLLLVPKVEEE